MAKAGLTVDVSALARAQAFVQRLSDKQVKRATDRAFATLKRKMVPEAARLLSADVLNLRPRQISPHLSVEVSGGDTLILRGDKSRLPLDAFGATWGGRNTPGAVAALWRDQGPMTFAHTFKIKGKKQVWQRVPFTGQVKSSSKAISRGFQSASSGLVQRLPIVVRKGPSFSRAVLSKKHGDIYPPLLAFSNSTLVTEIRRLLAVEAK